MTTETSMFIVGKREHGIVCITIEPFKANYISPDQIEEYEKASGKDAFADAGAGLISFADSEAPDGVGIPSSFSQASLADKIGAGVAISNADIAYVTKNTVNNQAGFSRFSMSPVGDLAETGQATSNADIAYVTKNTVNNQAGFSRFSMSPIGETVNNREKAGDVAFIGGDLKGFVEQDCNNN